MSSYSYHPYGSMSGGYHHPYSGNAAYVRANGWDSPPPSPRRNRNRNDTYAPRRDHEPMHITHPYGDLRSFAPVMMSVDTLQRVFDSEPAHAPLPPPRAESLTTGARSIGRSTGRERDDFDHLHQSTLKQLRDLLRRLFELLATMPARMSIHSRNSQPRESINSDIYL